MSATVSIVLINRDGGDMLGFCLESLKRQTCQGFELIIVDNGSADGSAETAVRLFPAAILICNSGNEGYCKAANRGAAASSGEFVVFLNNDLEVHPLWLERLAQAMRGDERVGCCSSKQLNFKNRKIIDSCGMRLFRGGYALNRGRGEKDDGQYDRVEEVFGPAGAAAMYRRKMLEEIGLFDEDYFAYQEEFDLCWRARLAGWKCVHVPESVVYHMGGMTAAAGDESFLIYHMERNRIFTLVKDYPAALLAVCLPWLVKYELDILWRLLKGETAPWRARMDALRLVPSMLARRKAIQAGRRVGSKELKRWLE